LPGARLLSLEVKNLADLDAPLVLAMKIRVQSFALPRGGELVIAPPFQLRLTGLASLRERETPLYISEQASTRSQVRLRVSLPEGARVVTPFERSAREGSPRLRSPHRDPGGPRPARRVLGVSSVRSRRGRVSPARGGRRARAGIALAVIWRDHPDSRRST
jgi:hypothetical protein